MRELRLVVDAPPSKGRDAFADWADARLFKIMTVVGETPSYPLLAEAQGQQAA